MKMTTIKSIVDGTQENNTRTFISNFVSKEDFDLKVFLAQILNPLGKFNLVS